MRCPITRTIPRIETRYRWYRSDKPSGTKRLSAIAHVPASSQPLLRPVVAGKSRNAAACPGSGGLGAFLPDSSGGAWEKTSHTGRASQKSGGAWPRSGCHRIHSRPVSSGHLVMKPRPFPASQWFNRVPFGTGIARMLLSSGILLFVGLPAAELPTAAGADAAIKPRAHLQSVAQIAAAPASARGLGVTLSRATAVLRQQLQTGCRARGRRCGDWLQCGPRRIPAA